MANIFVPFSGASVADVENLVTLPMEQILAEIEQVEHLYAVSQPGMAVFTVQFKVNGPAKPPCYGSTMPCTATQTGNLNIWDVGQIIVKPKGIDDVPQPCGANNPSGAAWR